MGRVWSSASQFGALGGEYVNLGTGAGGILLMQVVAFESRKRHAMLECTMTSSLTWALRQFSTGLVLGIVVFCQNESRAQEAVDIVEYFARAQDARGSGLARKSQPVDVRPAKPDEVIVTMIKG